MSVNKIVIVIFSSMSFSFAFINTRGPTVISDCTNCINNIITNDFKEPGLLIFANTINVSSTVFKIRTELLKSINEKVMFNIKVMSPTKKTDICDQDRNNHGALHFDPFDLRIRTANYFIIIIDSYEDFTHSVTQFMRSRIWNPYAKFVVLLFNVKNNNDITTRNKIENILTCLFKYNVLNIVVVLPQASPRTASIYSWQPYDPPRFCGYFNETAENRLKQENVCVKGKLKNNTNVFKNKVPDDMSGCVLNVLAIKRLPYISDDKNDFNLEKIFLNKVLERYNMTANYTVTFNYRGERENRKWNGGLMNIIAKKAHVLLGGIFPDYDVHEDFECSMSYLQDSYTWVVPKAKKLPPWASQLSMFQSFVWYSVISVLFIAVISWRIIGQLCGDSLYNRMLEHCFLNTWMSMIGLPVYKRPVKESLRIFFVFLCLYNILLFTSMNAKFIDTLTNPSYEYQMQTVQELVNSGLKFGGSQELHDLFKNSSDPLDYIIGDRWINVMNVTAALIDIAVHRNFSVFCSRLELADIAAMLPELSDGFKNYKYYAFEENMFSVPMEIIGLKGFPLMQEFTDQISSLKLMGLNEFLKIRYRDFVRRRRAQLLRFIMYKDNDNFDVKPLSVRHILGGFLVLSLGYLGGTISFCIEIVLNTNYIKRKLSQWKNK